MRAIDADAMLARLEEWNTSDSTDKALYNFTLHRVLEQPTIEPQLTGRWIQIEESIKVSEYKCSECGRIVWDDRGYDPYVDYPYCHCGARMESAE